MCSGDVNNANKLAWEIDFTNVSNRNDQVIVSKHD